MEPVSAVGFVAAIVQLIETTTKVIGYVNDVKDGPAERAQFARHASSLLALLIDLRYRAEESKPTSISWLAALRGLRAPGGPLDQLQSHMEHLARKLEPSTGRLQRVGKALAWVLDKKEMEELLTRIERVKTLVMLALQNDLLNLALAMKGDLDDLKKDIRAANSEAVLERKDEEFTKVTTWLSSLDFAAKQVDFSNRRQPGTGEWLLSDPGFLSWLGGEKQTLWCPGLPGAGKTTLAAMVIDWLESQHRGIVIYLYCNYKEEAIQTPHNMLGSLLKQIVQQKIALPEEVRSLHKEHLQKQTLPKLDELARLFVQEVKTRSAVFVVIDALDECAERGNTRGTLLDTIERLPSNARVLITSRYSPTIQDGFKMIPHIIADIRATPEDVKRYVQARIEKERALAKHVGASPGLMEDIVNTIAEESRGMFLLAQLHMDSLAKKLTRREVRAALSSLPKELDETYDQAIQRIDSQDEGQTALAHRVLYWISCSLRPLTVAELRHALAVEPGDRDLDEDGLHDPELLVYVCAGLVTVDEESHQVRLVHYTTQDYFKRIGIARLSVATSTIARTCLTYLLFDTFSTSTRFFNPYRGLPSRFAARRIADTIRRVYPFLSYAASYWRDHERDEMEDDVRELVMDFLGNTISIWNANEASDKKQVTFASAILGGNNPDWTRLHAAASAGLFEITQILLADGADPNAEAGWGTTPLHLAAAEGHTPIVSLLLHAGALVSPVTGTGPDMETPLHMAAENGHESVVRLLIRAGADSNACESGVGVSPLFLALRNSHVNVARFLVEEGADVNQKSDDGETPLNEAIRVGGGALVPLLLDNGADISARDWKGWTPLHAAVWFHVRRVELVELLIAMGVEVSAKDRAGQTALHGAAWGGQAEVVQILLDNGIDILAEDRSGRTALHEAASKGHDNILKMLLERNGNRKEMHRWLTTVRLKAAVAQADEDEVRTLLGNGADLNLQVKTSNYTFLHQAVVSGRCSLAIIDLLLAHGVDINATYDGKEATILHYAARENTDVAMVQILLQRGADIAAVDSWGRTALDWARFRGNEDVVSFLTSYNT